MVHIQFRLNDRLFLKDPQQTDLGLRILSHGVTLIDRLGFEKFTFRKLAQACRTSEASVYRYFETKHRLLLYLAAWYWSWLEYRVERLTLSVEDPSHRLTAALRVLTERPQDDPGVAFINMPALGRIMVTEMDKTYLTKWVDLDNKEGLFGAYKALCKRVAAMIREVNPAYPFPHTLVSTCIQAFQQQLFYSEHLPSLTDFDSSNREETAVAFFHHLVWSVVR